jgi:cytoskeleton protein RodZ
VELPESGAKRTGAMLLAGRTAAGLELTDIARETRVPLRHLKALENDRHDELPALPYAIGFVKAYARAVGLDSETVASQFRSETSKSAHVPTPMTLEPLDERRLPSRGMVVGSFAVVAVIIAGLSAWGAGVFDAAPPTAVVARAPVAADAPTAAPGAEAAIPAVVAAPVAVPPATGVAAAGPVVLTAKEDVWVKIYDKATRTSIKIGVLKAGESFPVPANPPGLLLWTGKAGALDITVGGRAIPPLGGPVETVRDVSLAAADLVARPAPGAAAGTPAATTGPAPTGLKPIATIPGT